MNGFFDLIGAITSAFNSFTSSVSEYINNTLNLITNTGQGIFAGIIQGLYTLGSWIYNSLSSLGNFILQALYQFGNWIAQGLAWIRNGLIQIGAFIYNSIIAFLNWVVEQISNFIQWVFDLINANLQNINNLFNSIVQRFYNKFYHLLAFNITYSLVKKSVNKIIENPNKKNILGLFISPFVGLFSANIINSFITKAPQTINLIPQLSYWKPQISKIEEKTPEEIEVPKTLYISALVNKEYITNINDKVNISYTNVISNSVSVSESVSVTSVTS